MMRKSLLNKRGRKIIDIEETPVKVLSLFDGIACARVALERVGIPVEKYYASEIEKDAIKIVQKNYPDIIQLGDVRNVIKEMVGEVDLIIGGSPCQDLSIAKSDRKGLKGERSSLFFEYVRLLKEIRPEYFIFDNVASMKRSDMWTMTSCLYDIFPTMIDAALVSAQHRERYFWIGKKTGDSYKKVWTSQPSDRRIILKDILEKDVDKKYFLVNYTPKYNLDFPIDMKEEKYRTLRVGGSIPTIKLGQLGSDSRGKRIYSIYGKSATITTSNFYEGGNTELYYVDSESSISQIRKLTPVECERLQGIPDNYTSGISDSKRYKVLGNAFNADIVAHILSELFKNLTLIRKMK